MVSELKQDIQNLLNDITTDISKSKTTSELEDIRINSLGKKGSVTLYLKNIREFDIETKKEIGAYLNDTKNKIIQVYFTKNDKKARPKTFRYSKCGIDEVMKKVNHYIEKEQEIYQNQFTDDIIYK